MDQIRIGAFLKELRKEKELTQEQLAEKLNVSGRTVSRWETGSNMPDIGMLVELADFYEVSIPEIIAGERKSEIMNQDTRETAVAMAEYSRNEVKVGKLKVIGYLTAAFGLFIIISALAIFPSDSSWGSIYATLGSIILLIGVFFSIRTVLMKRSWRVLILVGCAVLLFGAFTVSDYIAVTQFNQVPRFRYETSYDSRNPDQLVHKTLFFTVVQKNPGTKDEQVYIVK
ncbi:MAG: helix-turn-helix domain-containing protein [Oscillospiraceae bacterium]|nr:helix-turn-helix domain-containing protein [Oscillospiraceae bacterium]